MEVSSPQQSTDQIRLAAMAVNHIGLKLCNDFTHLIAAVYRIEARNDTHMDSVFLRFSGNGPSRKEISMTSFRSRRPYQRHNMRLGAANITAAHHL